jgi:uncharacterized protein YcfJ
MNRTGCGLVTLCMMLVLVGCETMQSNTAKGTALGGIIGAGTGAIVGEQTGKAGAGTAIGAGVGAISGALIGKAMDNNKQAAQRQHYPATPAAQVHGKFCPVGGEKYELSTVYCPIHGVELRQVQ